MNENQINKIEEMLRFGKKMQGTKSDKNSAINKQKTNEKQNSNVRFAYLSTIDTLLNCIMKHSYTLNNTSTQTYINVNKSSKQLHTK